jgi:hypothetical protein
MHELGVGTTRDMTSVITGIFLASWPCRDCTVSLQLAKAYLDQLQAPEKGFSTFEHSAHSPMFEEPATMKRIIRRDVLSGTNTLADGT